MRNAFRIPYCTRPYSFKKGRDIIEKTGILGWSGKKVVIGVAGTQSRCGVTHFVLCAANYLSNVRKSV